MYNDKPDLMIDIEALSLDNFYTWILSVAAVGFHPHDTPGTIVSNWAVRLGDSAKSQMPRLVDASTVNWWLAPEREAARAAMTKLEMVGYEEGLQQLAHLINSHNHIWARGPQFDLQNIWQQCQVRGIELTRTSYEWRDSRTLTDAWGAAAYRNWVKGNNPAQHSCIEDARTEAHYVQLFYRAHNLDPAQQAEQVN